MASDRRVLVADSATLLDGGAAGAVVVTGSHGGAYPGRLVVAAGARAAVFNDAGVGRDGAGIAALDHLDRLGLPAVAVGHDTARIGDGADMLRRGVVRHANRLARALGCDPPLPCRTAVRLLAASAARPGERTVTTGRAEARHLLVDTVPQIWALDSASLAEAEDAGRILLTGSHGGLLGGDPASALKIDAAAAVYNDAGIGADGAGLTRLPVLDRRDIPAATVSAASARIGDGRSTYTDGVLSAANRTAAALGAVPGMTTRAFVALVADKTR
jgi:hypothetical protein